MAHEQTTRLDDVLRLLDPPKGGLWHGGASPLGSLRGVTAAAAAWKPAPDRLSIWQLTLHMAYWKYRIRSRISGGDGPKFPRSPADFPGVPDPATEPLWKKDRQLLRSEHTALLADVRAFDPARLDEHPRIEGSFTYMDLIAGIMMHDTYHTGQIQMLKRLYSSLHPSI